MNKSGTNKEGKTVLKQLKLNCCFIALENYKYFQGQQINCTEGNCSNSRKKMDMEDRPSCRSLIVS